MIEISRSSLYGGAKPSQSRSKVIPYGLSEHRVRIVRRPSMMSTENGPHSRSSMRGRSRRDQRMLCCRPPLEMQVNRSEERRVGKECA